MSTRIRRGRLRVALAALAATVAFGVAPSASPAAGIDAAPDRPMIQGSGTELHVMSFNLRFASDTPPNSWPERRPVMRELLLRAQPDLIGTQEGLFAQLQDIQADLPARYDSIGLGREGGSRGEFMMIFYDTTRLTPLEFDHYWLSDTPEVIGSQTWGGCCPRMVTWVRFRDLRTDEEFYALNTHLEAFSADARERSALLIRDRLADFDPDLPVVVTGDFNEAAGTGSTAYNTLVSDGPFIDTWETAEQRGELFGTFHGFGMLVPGGNRIDWILTTPDVQTTTAAINTHERDGQFPSDHLPVEATLRLPA
jgi:endonuclease/exonuclease/phosphatase family metal-dependent hydrolase